MNINLWQALELKPYNTAQTVYAEIGKILVDNNHGKRQFKA